MVRRLLNLGLGGESEDLIESLSIMMSGGIGITEALDASSEEMKSGRMRKMVDSIKRKVGSGRPLWRSLDESNLFPDRVISLIKIGEDSGRLNENLDLVAKQQAKNKAFKSKIRSAMLYPVIVITVMVVLGLAIAWFILPMLATVFGQLQADLPLITSILIQVGVFFEVHGRYFVPGVVLAIGLIYFLTFSFSRTRFIGQAILLSLPGIKDLVRNVEMARFGQLLGMLLEAGIPITQALESIASGTTIERYRRFYEYLLRSIEDGRSIRTALREYKGVERLIPAPVRHLIIAGERSGNLSGSLLKIGESFESKADLSAKNLTVILEPIMLIIVWLGVMGVALAVLLPIYGLIGGF